MQVDDVEIVALWDSDSKSLAADQKTASKRHKSRKPPRGYGDFRELLNQEQPISSRSRHRTMGTTAP